MIVKEEVRTDMVIECTTDDTGRWHFRKAGEEVEVTFCSGAIVFVEGIPEESKKRFAVRSDRPRATVEVRGDKISFAFGRQTRAPYIPTREKHRVMITVRSVPHKGHKERQTA
ncbi:MAG: hypothetical protein AB200_01040 [Parcubacteria bacterium C7867-005]|nr:MAG: hypothetical protein AB200_01040 [Parcubacteria bacterium C7867-005]